jgi:hypothetical protein
MNPRVSFERVGLSAFDSTHSRSLLTASWRLRARALQLLDALNLNHGDPDHPHPVNLTKRGHRRDPAGHDLWRR